MIKSRFHAFKQYIKKKIIIYIGNQKIYWTSVCANDKTVGVRRRSDLVKHAFHPIRIFQRKFNQYRKLNTVVLKFRIWNFVFHTDAGIGMSPTTIPIRTLVSFAFISGMGTQIDDCSFFLMIAWR